MYGNNRRPKAKQNWQVGETVKIGFLSGFEVKEKVPTPGDSIPDKYVLERNGKAYEFTPHIGLVSLG